MTFRKVYYRTTDKETGKQTWHPVPGLVISGTGEVVAVKLWKWEEKQRGKPLPSSPYSQVLYTKRAKGN